MDVTNMPRILLIEDDMGTGSVIRSRLEPMAKVDWLTEGEGVSNAFQRNKPDLVLLDIQLPGTNGFEVFRELRELEHGRDIPIIFITGDQHPETEAKGLAIGAADFIRKPIRPDLLSMRILAHLDLKRHKDEMQQTIESQTREIKMSQEGIISSLAILAEFRDEETGKHIKRTKSYVEVIVNELKKLNYGDYSDTEYDTITESSILHDLGKIGIQDHILIKPGQLTPEEFETIKAHTRLGSQAIARTENLCGSTPFLRFAREIAECHHERWDGNGYPNGLKGEEIPLCARIMAIADVYDALITRRPYKKNYSHEDAVKEMVEKSPGHFDPFLLELFKKVQPKFRDISNQFMGEWQNPA